MADIEQIRRRDRFTRDHPEWSVKVLAGGRFVATRGQGRDQLSIGTFDLKTLLDAAEGLTHIELVRSA